MDEESPNGFPYILEVRGIVDSEPFADLWLSHLTFGSKAT